MPEAHQVFGGVLQTVTDIPQRVWLKNAAGEVIDEAMSCREGNAFLITCHGGPGVRLAVEEELAQAGLSQTAANLYGECTFVSRTLTLLQLARGPAAVRMVLEAAKETESLRNLLSSPEQIRPQLAESESFRYLFSPPRIQLWGPVNAGKSSLLNKLCGQPLAAVGDEPGLTRDVIEGRLEHQGFELRLFDAPGHWVGGVGVDAEAQALAREWRGEADLVLELTPPGAAPELPNSLVVASRADAPGADGVSTQRPETVEALKSRLVEHFFGRLAALPPSRRFLLHPDLRNNLESLGEGRLNADQIRRYWLD
ncbi:MAG: 50S ribosome-binding GTPase [Planctomycetes bacterium]|nr:50S ribosome-binding GTPase [Planctomycetota bacterium]